jgi:serine/threonine protein kinase
LVLGVLRPKSRFDAAFECEEGQTLISWTEGPKNCKAFVVESFERADDFTPPLPFDGIYAVGHDYTFPKIVMATLNMSFESPDGKAGLSFTLANAPLGAMIDLTSGLIRLIAEEPYKGNMSLDVIDSSSGARATVERIALDIRHFDLDTPALGPNNQACENGGVAVDGDGDERFDLNFTCECGNLFTGDNCENQPTASKSKGVTAIEGSGIIAAIVLGVLLVVAAVQYRKYREHLRPVDFDGQFDRMLQTGEISKDQLNATLKPREIKRHNVMLLEQVGQGAFGAVWKAKLDESKSTNGVPEYMVAAKTVLDKEADADATNDLLNEAAVMAQVAGADGHPNLVSLIGVVTSGNPLILLLSYAEHGSLLGVLSARAAAGEPVSPRGKVEMAAQTALGMAHLSGKRFIHRDLAARNVLLSSGESFSGMVCKVADFGLARGSTKENGGKSAPQENTDDYYRSQRGVFPVRWTAPEAMETLVFTYMSDVWSFGIVLVEIFGDGEKPYHSMKSNADVMTYTMSGSLHPKPNGCDDTMHMIMTRCWDPEPSQRPPFSVLAAKLASVADAMGCTSGGLATEGTSVERAKSNFYLNDLDNDYLTTDLPSAVQPSDSLNACRPAAQQPALGGLAAEGTSVERAKSNFYLNDLDNDYLTTDLPSAVQPSDSLNACRPAAQQPAFERTREFEPDTNHFYPSTIKLGL